LAFERFFFIVTREPLPEVPVEEKLSAYCDENPQGCPWKPKDSQWAQLLAGADTKARESQSRASGQLQTAVERKSIRREVGLLPGAPKPSNVKMNESRQAGMLIMNVVLTHKPIVTGH